jgi:hypothetical protein
MSFNDDTSIFNYLNGNVGPVADFIIKLNNIIYSISDFSLISSSGPSKSIILLFDLLFSELFLFESVLHLVEEFLFL